MTHPSLVLKGFRLAVWVLLFALTLAATLCASLEWALLLLPLSALLHAHDTREYLREMTP